MMQGDQYKLPIELKYADDSYVTIDDVKDVEIFIGQIRKTISLGEITFDSEKNAFMVSLLQKDTFVLNGKREVQARILFKSGDVVGINLGNINIESSTSKVVLK